MWNSAWNELREVVYVAVMVGGLSAVGVGGRGAGVGRCCPEQDRLRSKHFASV
jgi:hypothetical protein